VDFSPGSFFCFGSPFKGIFFPWGGDSGNNFNPFVYYGLSPRGGSKNLYIDFFLMKKLKKDNKKDDDEQENNCHEKKADSGDIIGR
jgi:hypothetical protein